MDLTSAAVTNIYNTPPFWLTGKPEALAAWEREQSANRVEYTERALRQGRLLFESLTNCEQKKMHKRVYGHTPIGGPDRWGVDLTPIYVAARAYVRDDLGVDDDPPFFESDHYGPGNQYGLLGRAAVVRAILGEGNEPQS